MFPESASTAAPHVDMLFYFMLAVTGGVALLIACLIVYFCFKYRRRSEDEIPPPTVERPILHTAWIVIPLGVFMVMFVWGASVYFRELSQPQNALEINVIAKQWMWKFQHPEGQREINELHVPVNRQVKLILTSQDVIHSFFVPAFRLHRDVLPNRYTTVWFEATKPGSYHLFCSQYCGTQHASMGGSVVVMEQADYQAWLNGGAQDSLAAKGETLFQKYSCAACHTGDSQARGPNIAGLYKSTVYLDSGERVRADENYIRESILNPSAQIVAGFQNIMPTFQGQLSEEELLQLVAYIKSLNGAREFVPPVSSPDSPQPLAAPGTPNALPANANGKTPNTKEANR